MLSKYSAKYVWVFFLFFLTIYETPVSFSEERGLEEVRLSNGFRAIIIENHNAPVVASVIMVHTGSSRENYAINGVSHMLEHLLFNGTGKRTQKELYEEQDFYGIYNNAHTTEEYTNYMVLSNKEHCDRALDIQSDMLFNSTIPEGKFEKEKGIVLNEIAMNRMSDEYLARDFFKRKYFYGSPFNLTVLGLPETIKGMDRQTVVDFYKRYYVPNNMTAIVMGDFRREEMLKKIKKYFGNVPPGLLSDFNAVTKLSDKTEIHISKKKIGKIIAYMAVKAPIIENIDFFSYNLLIQLVSIDFKDRINSRLRDKGQKEALNISIDMGMKKGFSSLVVSFTLPPEGNVKGIVASIEKELNELPDRKFSPRIMRGIISSLKMEELSTRERMHYFGMMASIKIAVGGWNFARDFVQRLEAVTMERIEDTAKKYFSSPPSFFVSVLTPGGEEREISEEEKKEYYKTSWKASSYSEESRSLVKSWKPSRAVEGLPTSMKESKTADEEKLPKKTDAKITKKVLDNGLTVLIKKSGPGGTFALHVLFKNRSRMESVGKEGMAELLHNLLTKGTESRDKKKLRSDLMAIGAKIKTADNPHIPYDDYYLSREYSYIRFETIDKYFKEGLDILADLIRNPLLAHKDVEEEKNKSIDIAKDKEEDARTISSRLLYSVLLKGSGYDKPVSGTPKSIKSISTEDLKKFHKKYFAPQNLIISIVSGLDADDVLKKIKLEFGDMSGSPAQLVKKEESKAVKTSKYVKSKTIHKKLGKSQSYIRLGKIIEMDPKDSAAVGILSFLLSDHIAFQLREKEGLSYSLWAGFMSVGDVDMFSAAIGTTPDKIESAGKGLLREISEFKNLDIKQKDIQRFINQSGSKHLMRTMTRIGQAYGLGIAEFRGKDQETFAERAKKMKKVTVSDIQSATLKYLDMDGIVTVIVE